MGKRELLLIGAFVVLGTLLYQVTAPARPGQEGFSLRGMMDSLRRGMASHREYPADERRESFTIDPRIAEIRIAGAQQVRIEGIAGDTAELVVQVFSTGADENEARELAALTNLRQKPSGDILSFEFTYPREGRQRTSLTLRVPHRLRTRVTRTRVLEAMDVSALELDGTRGDVTVAGLKGTLTGSHSGGTLTVDRVQAVDLTVRQADLTLTALAGSVRLNLTGGRLTGRDVGGPIELTATRADIEVARPGDRLSAELTEGRFEASGLAHEARVDARGTELRFELARAVPVTAITSDESITVQVPGDAGFALDATVDDGEIRLPDGGPEVTAMERTRQARGALRGGGPMLALRTTRGDIVVR